MAGSVQTIIVQTKLRIYSHTNKLATQSPDTVCACSFLTATEPIIALTLPRCCTNGISFCHIPDILLKLDAGLFVAPQKAYGAAVHDYTREARADIIR